MFRLQDLNSHFLTAIGTFIPEFFKRKKNDKNVSQIIKLVNEN